MIEFVVIFFFFPEKNHGKFVALKPGVVAPTIPISNGQTEDQEGEHITERTGVEIRSRRHRGNLEIFTEEDRGIPET